MDTDAIQIMEMLLSSSSDSLMETSSESSSFSSSNGSEPFGGRKHMKVNNFFETCNSYSASDFVKHFRIKRSMVVVLTEHYSQSDAYKKKFKNNGGCLPISADREMLLFLWYMANTDTYRVVGNLFGVSKTCAWRIVSRVCGFLISIGHTYVKWSPDLESVQHEFEMKAGIPGIIGAIDCSDIRIKPPNTNKEDYYNRKKFYSIKMQAVVDASTRFSDIYIGEPGSLHDSRVLRRSPLFRKLHDDSNFLENSTYFIIGDSAYSCLDWLVPPYKDNGGLTQQEKNFNYLHSKTRIVVEHSFGLMKSRFRRIKFFTEHHNVGLVVNLTTAACILHNICIDNSDNLSLENIEPNENFGPNYELQSEHRRISNRRQELLNELINRNII